MFSLLSSFCNNKYVSSIINFFKYGIIICIIPPLLNYAALNRETSVLGEHGLPYDVGNGQKLFLSCKGKGVPTIIMDSPIGVNSDIYLNLQEKLSEITKACVYDRAGLGLSERPVEIPVNKSETVPRAKIQRGEEFTIERMAEDLRRLISSSSQQERPIMFIGSELGALIARFYAQIYQDDVSHLVLINPLVEGLFNVDDSIWKDAWYEKIVPKFYGYALGSVIGLNRFLLMANLIEPQIHSNQFKDDVTSRQKHLMCNPRHLFSLLDEFVNLNETLAQMKLIWSIKQFPQNVSVTILSSVNDEMFALKNMYEEKTDKKLKLKNAWKKSVEYLKDHLHPNAKYYNYEDSIYKQLYQNPNIIFNLIEELIVDWRRKNVVNKSS